MAVITLSLPEGDFVCNGKHISFSAPCACTGVTGVSIDSTTYALVNAQGNDYVSNGGIWESGAYMTIMLDCTNSKAYVVSTLQNISGKEDSTNKVTSISSSSTDTQYPSAKCVYDLIGNVESALASI